MWARQERTWEGDERREREDEEKQLYGEPQHESEGDGGPEERMYGEPQHEETDPNETPEEREFELVVPPSRPTKLTP